MKNKWTVLLLAVLFLGLLAGAYVLYGNLSESSTPQTLATQPSTQSQPQRAIVPDFTVYDKDGNPVTLHDFLGKPIVLNFWASWCGPCKSEMPAFQEQYESLGDDVHFIMVNMTDGSRETVQTATTFLNAQGYTFPVYFDSDRAAAITYGAYSLPTTYFIDENGYCITYAMGALSADQLRQGIDFIYKEES